MTTRLLLPLMGLIFWTVVLQGCAAPRAYTWNGYDSALYRYYKTPQERAEYERTLFEIITAGEQQGQRVPPGIYAEYGYVLFQSGKRAEAEQYFRKEREVWPESVVLMDKMIRNTHGPVGKP